MTAENETPTFTMQTPAAVLAPKQQYLNLMMNTIFKFGVLCSATEATKDVQAKIGMLTQMLINYVPNPKERKRLTEMRNTRRADAKKIKDLDAQREALFVIDSEIVGEIMTLLDDVLAIVERQAILKTAQTGNSDLENKYYPDGKPVCIQEQEDTTEGDE